VLFYFSNNKRVGCVKEKIELQNCAAINKLELKNYEMQNIEPNVNKTDNMKKSSF